MLPCQLATRRTNRLYLDSRLGLKGGFGRGFWERGPRNPGRPDCSPPTLLTSKSISNWCSVCHSFGADVAVAVAAVYVAGVLTLFSNNLLHELTMCVCNSLQGHKGHQGHGHKSLGNGSHRHQLPPQKTPTISHFPWAAKAEAAPKVKVFYLWIVCKWKTFCTRFPINTTE